MTRKDAGRTDSDGDDGRWRADDPLIGAYLARLGFDGPPPPTLTVLARLIARHIAAVPFENLDVAAGRPIRLGGRAAIEKIVQRRRGGFCFELNEAFRVLLDALGFSVRRIEGRVHVASEGRFGAPFDHLALVVALGGQEWLVDVGFGDGCRGPISLPEGVETDISGSYRVAPGSGGLLVLERIAVGIGGPVQPLYAMTMESRALGDFAAMCAFHQSDPGSVFMRGPIATLATETGRITLAGERLIRSGPAGRQEEMVAPAERAAILRDVFGVG